jgi:hypothetical protein
MGVDPGRRAFNVGIAASAGVAVLGLAPGFVEARRRRPYTGPNVIIVRFDGGSEGKADNPR